MYFAGWYDNANFDGEPVVFPYSSKTNTTLYAKWSGEPICNGESFETAYISEENISYDISIIQEKQCVYYKFIPTESCTFRIQTNGDKVTNGYLYGSEFILLSEDEGDIKIYNNNFMIECSLTLGEVYYIKLALGGYNETGEFTFIIEKYIESELDVLWEEKASEYTAIFEVDGIKVIPAKQSSLNSLNIADKVLISVDSIYAVECSEDTDINDAISLLNSMYMVNGEQVILFSQFEESNIIISNYMSFDNIIEGNYVINGDAYFTKDYLKLIKFIGTGGEYIIPDTVTEIGMGSFYNCQDLKKITIPNSITQIGNGAFLCSSLTSIIIPNSVTSIGISAFSGCMNLSSITIPNSVTSIGLGAFSGCMNLSSITIPNSVTSIGAYAFEWCGIISITIPNSVTIIGENAFSECTSIIEIYCETESKPEGWNVNWNKKEDGSDEYYEVVWGIL